MPLDPRSPLVVDTKNVPRSPGTQWDWSADVPFTDRLGLDLIAVPANSPVSVRVSLTMVSEGILVSGTVSAPVHGECARCLTAIDETLTVSVSELFAFEDSTTAETTDAEEVMRLQGDLLDLEPLVRDSLVFEMPGAPLCRPDCQGLCPDCGEPWESLPADHGHETVDPRWEALKKLL